MFLMTNLTDRLNYLSKYWQKFPGVNGIIFYLLVVRLGLEVRRDCFLLLANRFFLLPWISCVELWL